MENSNTPTPEGQSLQDSLQMALNRDPSAQSRLPIVTVPGNGVSITNSARELFTILARSNRFFCRGQDVVQVTEQAGDYFIQLLKPVRAQSLLEDFVQFEQ